MKLEMVGTIRVLVADEGKMLTTVEPSSVRYERVYLGVNDSPSNYVEVDDIDIIEPIEPEVPQGPETIDYKEAYLRLSRENEVLTSNVASLNDTVDIMLLDILDLMFPEP